MVSGQPVGRVGEKYRKEKVFPALLKLNVVAKHYTFQSTISTLQTLLHYIHCLHPFSGGGYEQIVDVKNNNTHHSR